MDRSPLPAEACPFIGQAYRKLGQVRPGRSTLSSAASRPITRNARTGVLRRARQRVDVAVTTPAQKWYQRAIEIAPPHYDSEVGPGPHPAAPQPSRPGARAGPRGAAAARPTHVDAVLVAGLAEQRAGHRRRGRAPIWRRPRPCRPITSTCSWRSACSTTPSRRYRECPRPLRDRLAARRLAARRGAAVAGTHGQREGIAVTIASALSRAVVVAFWLATVGLRLSRVGAVRLRAVPRARPGAGAGDLRARGTAG